jgi:hypothetical protein
MATDVDINKLDDSTFDDLPDDRLPVDAITYDEKHHVARSHGYAFTFDFGVTPTGANDEFLYLKNDSSTDQVVITSLELTDAGAEDIVFAKCTGTPGNSPTAITPMNLLVGSSNVSDCTIYEKADITDLVLDSSDQFTRTTVADVRFDIVPVGQVIVVPPGIAVCLSAVTGTAAISGNCTFYVAKHPSA